MSLFNQIVLRLLFITFVNSFAGTLPLNPSFLNHHISSYKSFDFYEREKIISDGNKSLSIVLLFDCKKSEEVLGDSRQSISFSCLMEKHVSLGGDCSPALLWSHKTDNQRENNADFLMKSVVFHGIDKLDTAIYHSKNPTLYIADFPVLKQGSTLINRKLSPVYSLKNDVDTALELGDSIQLELGGSDLGSVILNSIAATYFMQGAYNKSLKSYKRVLDLSKKGNTDTHRTSRCLSYLNLANSYSGLGDFKQAFYHQDMYFSLNDSLQNEFKRKEIAKIQAEYTLLKNITEINNSKLKVKKAQLISYGLVFLLFLIVIAGWFLFKLAKLNRKNMRLEFYQQQLLNENKLKKMESLMQVRCMNAALDGRLEERKNIACILHNNVSSLLASASLHLHASRAILNCEVPEEINKSQEILSEAAQEIRDLSHTLMSSLLLKFGLDHAILDLCEQASNSKLCIKGECVGLKRYDQNFEIKMHAVVNELVNNILKHSGGDKASVVIEDKGSKIHLLITDNGMGFEMDKVLEKEGLGLSQVKYRVLSMDGVFIVNSKLGIGTEIFVSVPVKP